MDLAQSVLRQSLECLENAKLWLAVLIQNELITLNHPALKSVYQELHLYTIPIKASSHTVYGVIKLVAFFKFFCQLDISVYSQLPRLAFLSLFIPEE